ncbi:MAG: hypothetical protein AVW05_03265 [Hadesarchaea archaeon DG-33]|nr:MAG: hypothetical protein AVW05_03265 [Hadesarchaea archaeon DG-33]
MFVIFKALEYGYTPPLAMLVLATTLPWMAGLIPLLPAGIGTVDVAMILIFMKFMPPQLYPVAAAAWAVERAILFSAQRSERARYPTWVFEFGQNNYARNFELNQN